MTTEKRGRGRPAGSGIYGSTLVKLTVKIPDIMMHGLDRIAAGYGITRSDAARMVLTEGFQSMLKLKDGGDDGRG